MNPIHPLSVISSSLLSDRLAVHNALKMEKSTMKNVNKNGSMITSRAKIATFIEKIHPSSLFKAAPFKKILNNVDFSLWGKQYGCINIALFFRFLEHCTSWRPGSFEYLIKQCQITRTQVVTQPSRLKWVVKQWITEHLFSISGRAWRGINQDSGSL